jgi:hypothetical protein
MQLPQEIYDLIIDHLREDRPTLSHCALVSRAWVHRSQAHFFRFVILGGPLLRLWVDKFSSSDGRIHSFVKILVLCPPSNPFEYFKGHALAFKGLESLAIKGVWSPRGFQLFPCIHWFSHLRDTLKSLHLENVVLSPRTIAEFPRLEFLVVQDSALHRVGDTNEGDNTPAGVDPHGAFKGSLAFYTQSKDLEIMLLEAFPDCPLGYDAIRIGVTGYTLHTLGGSINRLISRCSSTLEVLDIHFQDERLCKSNQINHDPSCLTLTDRFGTRPLSLQTPSRDLLDILYRSYVTTPLPPLFCRRFQDDVQDHDRLQGWLQCEGALRSVQGGTVLVGCQRRLGSVGRISRRKWLPAGGIRRRSSRGQVRLQ